ncbi:NAD(P)H nitroreductase [Phytohalomonas tamaricis]|uniref:NAD(P)H nitroreductase n=1 Tax=Phytohalomonas tamaricis TaxID=2081032 RepID=UPI000D0B28EF|nr:NAD(P)H nitroreductase [Phytohalomonas tamaricis]
MDAMTLLHERSSMGKLTDQAPDASQLDAIYRAALRAPDHDQLTPWHFIEIAGAGRERLGELFARAVQTDDPEVDEQALDKARKKALRAPVIIAVIARVQEHHKVPRIEQIISAGCAAHAMLYAAQLQGLGAMWRTGKFSGHGVVREGLGVGDNDELVGFIYLGQPAGRPKRLPVREPEDFVERWQ